MLKNLFDHLEAGSRIAALEADLAQARAERDRAEKVVAYLTVDDGEDDLAGIIRLANGIHWQPDGWLATVHRITRGDDNAAPAAKGE